jgi:BlaI family transcriptional regulator, penicillinase repressor
MDEVWRQGSATVREVMRALNERLGKERAYTTIVTILARLERKGGSTARRTARASSTRHARRARNISRRDAGRGGGPGRGVGDAALVNFARVLAKLDATRRDARRRQPGADVPRGLVDHPPGC